MCLKSNINLKGWNSQVHRDISGKFESNNVSGDNVSREIGRNQWLPATSGGVSVRERQFVKPACRFSQTFETTIITYGLYGDLTMISLARISNTT